MHCAATYPEVITLTGLQVSPQGGPSPCPQPPSTGTGSHPPPPDPGAVGLIGLGQIGQSAVPVQNDDWRTSVKAYSYGTQNRAIYAPGAGLLGSAQRGEVGFGGAPRVISFMAFLMRRTVFPSRKPIRDNGTIISDNLGR